MFHEPVRIRCRRCHGWLGGGLVFLTLAGCQPQDASPRLQHSLATVQAGQEHVDKALEYLENLAEFEEHQAAVQASYQLNRWLESEKLSANWKPDEMVSRFPRAVRERGVLDELPRRSFSTDDIQVIQEAVWMRQISQWVSRQPLAAYIAPWLEQQKSTLGNHGAEQLATAYRLFDWTIRNIQLGPLMTNPDEAAGAPATPGDAAAASLPAALRGLPGPGYNLEPWQVLLYGNGDAWQRMRIFTLLARQQGIDVLTLAFPSRSIPPRPRPWVSAVLIKDQLYLFDTRLGLAIPGPNFTGIATLKQVRDDPTLLTALAIDDKHPYRVEPQDLAETAALVDVVAANLSQRMQQLETQLVGDHRTVLTVDLTSLLERAKACPGIYDVYVWSIPFEAVWYRHAYDQRLQEDERATAMHLLTFGPFLNHSPLARARYLYFRGIMDSDEDSKGAKTFLMDSRINQDHLNRLSTDEQLQRSLGLVRTGREPPGIWEAQVAAAGQMLLNTKQCASFWLGLFQLESGRTDSAVEWLRVRSLEMFPTGFWSAAARYNLARAYELMGQWEQAQQELLADTSPQEQGNYLRAKLLQRWRTESKPSSSAAPAETSANTKADANN